MKDVISGRQAIVRLEILRRILATLHDCETLYAADWGIAYDLQRAEQLIEREIRALSSAEDEEEDGGGSLRIAAIKGVE